MYYTGIGNRDTPDDYCQIISNLAKKLALLDWTLRSGGAKGADLAFEYGCNEIGGNKEIYLPWKYYNNNNSELYNIPSLSYKIARKIHPIFNKLSIPVQKLMARNVLQILGYHLNTPSKIVICYGRKNKKNIVEGGTGFTLMLAKNYNIPVLNLYDLNKSKLNVDSIIKIIYKKI